MGKPSKTERMKQRQSQQKDFPADAVEITKAVWDHTPKSQKKVWKDGTCVILTKEVKKDRKPGKPQWLKVYWRR